MSKLLITGGSGRLGKELKKNLLGMYPTRQELDILKDFTPKDCSMVIHMAAYTSVDGAETDRFKCFETNVMGTYNMLNKFKDKPFVYISSEHAPNPQNVYSSSKLVAEELVRNLASSYLIIRTLFKPTPYPWDNAWINQITQGDYVDVIAPLIAREIKEWNGESKTVYVGTGRKSMYELALRTRKDVKPTLVEDCKGARRAKDYL